MTEKRFKLAPIGGGEWGIIESGTPIGTALWLKVPLRAHGFAKKVVARLNGARLVDVLDGNLEAGR